MTALVSLCSLGWLFAFSGASASAEVTHPYVCQITAGAVPSATECNGIGNIVPGGPFGNPQGVAVDGAGQVYVSDGANKVVDVFDSLGNFTRQITGASPEAPFTEPWGVAVDGANNLWTADVGPGLMDKFDSSGGFLAQGTGEAHWGGGYTRSVAFSDASNHLYVADSGGDDLWVLNTDGTFNSDITGQWGGGCCFIYAAADNSGGATGGDVYVSSSNGTVSRIDGAGNPAAFSGSVPSAPYISGAQLTGTPAGSFGELTGVAVDSAGNVYVLDNGNRVVDEFDSTGLFLGQTSGVGTPTGSFAGLRGVAVNAAGNAVYVVDAAGVVDVFGPGVVVPDVTTGGASGVGKATATVEGTVNPAETSVTGCAFEYRTEAEPSYAHTAPCAQALPLTGNEPVAVSAELTGLTANTAYRYRLAATNAGGTNRGSGRTFTTPPAVDALSTGPAEAVTPTGATLTGSLSPDGTDAHYYFQYGTETSYGSTSPEAPGTDAGTASESVHAETTLAGLAANTTYHYRLVGVNSFGTTYGKDAVFTTSGPPTIIGESFSGVGSTRAALSAQINPDGFETHYRFEYGTDTSYGTSAPVPDGSIAAGFAEQATGVNVTGLKPETTYHFRVVASSEGGTVNGPDQTFTTLPPLLIDSESASSVAATSATLNAQINPLGSDTTAYFQYGTVSCTASPGSCTDLPLPPGTELGSGESDVTLSVHLQGLASGATYHYRVLAANALGAAEGADRTFTTQAAGTEITQPDGRTWELVSPPNKQGAGIFALGRSEGADIQASAEGDGITYAATAPFVANPAGSLVPETTQVISNRQAPGSWETADITTPHDSPAPGATGHSSEYKLFSSDLSLGLVEPAGNTPLSPLSAGSEGTLYFRMADGGYRALVTSANVPPGTRLYDENGRSEFTFVSATPDFSHVVIGSPLGLSEWAGGQLQEVAVLPDGQGAFGVLGEAGTGQGKNVRRAISNDGSRIVWESAERHYLRDMARGETVQIDLAQGAPEPAGVTSLYQTADGDGSRVFFTSAERLTADSTASAQEEDLYVFEVTSGAGQPLAGSLTDLSVDGNPGESADVRSVIGASEDGAYVYFAANGVLGDGVGHEAKRGNCQPAQQSTCNLYVEHYDVAAGGWTAPRLVASLADADSPSWGLLEGGGFGLVSMTSRVSPNGRYLAFMSQLSLTGYENRDANSGMLDEEVFLYDAGTGLTVCASCDPTGARPAGLFDGGARIAERRLIDELGLWQEHWLAGNIPGWNPENLREAIYQSRYLSDGGRLFFNSSDALVPADVNGKEDVYEYEPAGVGGCRPPGYGQSASVVYSQAVGGCVGLVSSGTSSGESAFMDASETGGDVFFLTQSRLASRDYDTSIDMYDAHECSASVPCAPTPPLVPPPCTTGDACKVAPTPQPTLFGAPASATFSGAGNVVPGTTTSSPSRAGRLARALKVCRKKPRHRRAGCERTARRRYGARRSTVVVGLSHTATGAASEQRRQK